MGATVAGTAVVWVTVYSMGGDKDQKPHTVAVANNATGTLTPANFTCITVPVEAALDSWPATAAMVGAIGAGYYFFAVDPIGVAQRVVTLVTLPETWRPWVAWVPVGGGILWGLVHALLIAGLPWIVTHYRGDSQLTLTPLAAFTTAWLVTSSATRLVDGLLVMPGCPRWVAVLLPLVISVATGMSALLVVGRNRDWPLLQHVLAAARWGNVLGKSSTDAWAAVKPTAPTVPAEVHQVNRTAPNDI